MGSGLSRELYYEKDEHVEDSSKERMERKSMIEVKFRISYVNS